MTSAPPFVPHDAGHATDDALADLIERDARALIAAGIEVKLGRYLDSIPGLESRPIAIDAAIEFVLRSATSGGHSEESAAVAMVREFPRLSMAVHRAILLNGQCGATATS